MIDATQALAHVFPDNHSHYDERDLALYALGVGAAADPLDERDLRLVYERHAAGFIGLPTYGVIPAINTVLSFGTGGYAVPGLNYGLERVLHGEHLLQVSKVLPRKQKLTHKVRVKHVFDKGSPDGKKGGAVVIFAFESFDERGELLFQNEVTTFVRGAGGFGGDRGPSADVNLAPERAPDATVEQRVNDNQNLLYRLSGDWNPLHADPAVAKQAGFARPILHGLCTFGYAVRHVLRAFAEQGDPRCLKQVKVRFSDVVLPGETLVTEMWKESDLRILFRVKAKARDKVVISNAAIELFPRPLSQPLS